MTVRLGDTHTFRWTTSDPATGAATNASAQTVGVYEENTDSPVLTPSPTNVATGHYRADVAVTVGNGFETNKVYNVIVESTIGGVACKGVVASFLVEARDLDEAVEGSYTLRQLTRLMASALLGKTTGGGTATIVFRSADDAKNRITATVDVNGNRTTVTLDET